MDSNISKSLNITPARKEDAEEGALLMYLAFDEFSEYLFGTDKTKQKLKFFKKLWLMDNNRLSSEYSYVVRNEEAAIGLISAYSGDLINKMFLPSFWAVIKVNPAMIKYIFLHPHYLYALLTSPEATQDEFYVFMLAVLPKYQKQGIGTKLLDFATEQAKKSKFKKLSLLVRRSNKNAIGFYEKYGFQKVKTYNRKPMDFYKMVKEIS